MIKGILLGKNKELISYSANSSIHSDKIAYIQELIKRYKELENMDGKQSSLYKEVNLINGLRAL